MSIAGPDPKWTVEPYKGYQINSTAISADGNRMLCGTSSEKNYGEFGTYCFDETGQQLWCDLFDEEIYQGIFWVAVSADGRYGAAGGALKKDGDYSGFLKAYEIETGEVILDETLYSRANEVEMSADGSWLAVVEGDEVRLYRLDDGSYVHTSSQTLSREFCISVGISEDGGYVVVGSYADDDDSDGAAGIVALYSNQDGQLSPAGEPWEASDGVLRVVITRDGQWWAASTKGGDASLFNQEFSLPNNSPLWTYSPPGYDLSYAYALAIALTSEDTVIVACGANESGEGHGCVFALKNVSDDGATGYEAQQLWVNALKLDPNPGVNMDAEATYVTATDGQPDENLKAGETPGNFYLFDRSSGDLLWSWSTVLMNWPMSINAAGTAVFGASDDGHAFYWGEPAG